MSWKYLSRDEIIALNQHLCRRTDQKFGLMAPELLDEAVSRPALMIDGYEPFPEIWEKAAVLMDSLLKNRPFLRSNVLTGCLATDIFLRRNGVDLSTQPEDSELIKSVALQQVTVLQIAEWLRGRASSPAGDR